MSCSSSRAYFVCKEKNTTFKHLHSTEQTRMKFMIISKMKKYCFFHQDILSWWKKQYFPVFDSKGHVSLTHWGRVMLICVSKLTSIGSDNGSVPIRNQAIIWTNDGLLLIGPLGTNFSEILIEILKFSFKKMHLKVSSAKRRPFCLGLNVLKQCEMSLNSSRPSDAYRSQ